MNPQEQVESFIMQCKKRGISLPSTCKSMLIVFCHIDGFIDAESLWLMMKKEGHTISLASVYNGLRWLGNKGYTQHHEDADKRCKVYKLTLPG
jgi:Fe2+ or Zn2+ uptake regulation protein